MEMWMVFDNAAIVKNKKYGYKIFWAENGVENQTDWINTLPHHVWEWINSAPHVDQMNFLGF